MAKELPYFKFEPAEWQNGDIQMCDFETQIKFLDICCAYWSRIGELPYAYAMQKLCGGNANALKTLEKYQIIKIEGELIRISFLDRQLEELQSKSEKARESAEIRWKLAKNDANALKTQSERNAKRKEENRKEKKKEDNKEVEAVFLSFRDELFQKWIDYRKEIKKPLKPTSIESLKKTWASKSDTELEAIINQSISNGWQGLFELKKENQQTLFTPLATKSNHVYHDPPEQDREARRIKNQLFLHTDKVRKDYILGFNYTEEQLQDYLEANIKGYTRP